MVSPGETPRGFQNDGILRYRKNKLTRARGVTHVPLRFQVGSESFTMHARAAGEINNIKTGSARQELRRF